MESLIKYSIPIKEYAKYLNDNNYPTKQLLSSDNLLISLGYILHFLSTKNIFIVVDNYNYVIFTDIKYDTLNGYTIKESNNETEIGIIELYKQSINDAFEFLNTPF